MKIDSLWSFANFDVIKKFCGLFKLNFSVEKRIFILYVYFLCYIKFYIIPYFLFILIQNIIKTVKILGTILKIQKRRKNPKTKTYFSLAIVHVKAINIVYC